MSVERLFIDSNIIIYLADSGPKLDIAEEVVQRGGVISVQVLNESANVLRKKAGMPMADIRVFLEAIRRLLEVIPVTIEVHDMGLEMAERHGLSIYDAMIVAAAKQAGCSVLLTEDMASGARLDGIQLINPFKTEN